MLVKLGRQQIPEYWRELKATVLTSLPKEFRKDPTIANKVLEELLLGTMEAWIPHKVEGDRARPVGFAITSILEEPITHRSSMQVFAASMTEPWDEDVMKMLLFLGSKYARSKGCATFSAYTTSRAVIEAASNVGLPTEVRYIVFPVGEEEEWADQVDPRGRLIIPTT